MYKTRQNYKLMCIYGERTKYSFSKIKKIVTTEKLTHLNRMDSDRHTELSVLCKPKGYRYRYRYDMESRRGENYAVVVGIVLALNLIFSFGSNPTLGIDEFIHWLSLPLISLVL